MQVIEMLLYKIKQCRANATIIKIDLMLKAPMFVNTRSTLDELLNSAVYPRNVDKANFLFTTKYTVTDKLRKIVMAPIILDVVDGSVHSLSRYRDMADGAL
jgi:hypothetical protein